MAGPREPDQGGKICVDCGATNTPFCRCNVDGVKFLCNRKQKRARSTDNRLSLDNDGWDDSLSCTNSATDIATVDSQPALASRKRQAAQRSPSRALGQDATSLDVQGAAGLVGQPALPSNGSFCAQRVRSSEVLMYSSGPPDNTVVMAPASQSPTLSVVVRAQQAQEEGFQSEIDFLMHPMSCYSSDERFPSAF